jgi:hypothetical protein
MQKTQSSQRRNAAQRATEKYKFVGDETTRVFHFLIRHSLPFPIRWTPHQRILWMIGVEFRIKCRKHRASAAADFTKIKYSAEGHREIQNSTMWLYRPAFRMLNFESRFRVKDQFIFCNAILFFLNHSIIKTTMRMPPTLRYTGRLSDSARNLSHALESLK